MTTTPISRTHRETLAHLKALKEITVPETDPRLAALDERIATVTRRINSGRGSQKLHNERWEILAALKAQRAAIIEETTVTDHAGAREANDFFRTSEMAASQEAEDAARAARKHPARDDDYTPEAVDRDAEEAEEIDPPKSLAALTADALRDAHLSPEAEAAEPTAVAAFLRAMVTEITQTSGHEARRSVLRTMAEAGYPHLVRIAMGDLLTTVANYATDPEMVQSLQRDTETAFDASARRDAAAQDEAEERIYRNGGPNP